MQIVYLDSVFVMNTLMDYWLLLCTARLSGLGLVRWRYWLGAVVGGVYAVAVFLPWTPLWLGGIGGKCFAFIALILVAFWGQRQWVRLGLVFLGLSCAMAGGVLGLGMVSGYAIAQMAGVFYTDISTGALLVAAVVGYGLIRLVFFAAGRKGLDGLLLPVTISHEGCKVEILALYDTGNTLKDCATGRSVLVVEAAAVATLWSKEVGQWLTPSRVANPIPLLSQLQQLGVSPRLIPYQSVGVGSGFLVGIACEEVEIGNERLENLVIALSPNSLGNGYSALWGQKGAGNETTAVEATNKA
ncbi:sigma-E processing peptidase SpoIIGA [Bengtsoniella intestinalis]|uniref:sigma-E processing peptidase SpoIIGA n=1 Tax=Bengtsoniella intestinalis TaxID=3073143 RepID=UPI00391F1DD7